MTIAACRKVLALLAIVAAWFGPDAARAAGIVDRSLEAPSPALDHPLDASCGAGHAR